MGDPSCSDPAHDELERRFRELDEALRELKAAHAREAESHAEEVAELRARLGEVERRANVDSGNSSRPPSSDPPWSKKRRNRRPSSGLSQGAQPGHPGHRRALADDVDEVVDHEPDRCTSCGHEELLGSGEPPRRHQVVDLPERLTTVVEHRLHDRICAGCGERVKARLPADVPRSNFGPGVHALVVSLTGGQRISRRETSVVLREVFGIEMSVGSVSNVEERMGSGLAGAHEEALTAVRTSSRANVDETPWNEAGELRWLWTADTGDVVAFRIDPRRNREALGRLIGTAYAGLVGSDRMGAYDGLPAERRQICLAHLARNFQARVEDSDERVADFGRRGFAHMEALMRADRDWRTHRDDARLRADVEPHAIDLVELLVGAEAEGPGGVAGMAKHLLDRFTALLTFAAHPGLGATNNRAERAVRKLVLWRKNSFFSQSKRGLRYVERISTVIATKRRRAEGVFEYLLEVARSVLHGTEAPSLLPQPAAG